MSQRRALTEIERFLGTGSPEVLSISGRWGVGKTYAWDEALKAHRGTSPLRRYAYVSVFGLRSLEALKTAIVQSTVSLNGNALEPTVESFVEHVSSFEGLRKLGEEASRKTFGIFSKGAASLPYVGKMADLLAPGAALLIRNQIICIDDIERAGQGLDVADILGLVSSLRERRGCKVVLLLNEDGLGDGQKPTFRAYLEKVVDQAIKFEPTAEESSAAALDAKDPLAVQLGDYTTKLGITNIRVIKRIRRFLSFIEKELTGLHPEVTDAVVHSIALIGWSVFEPGLAPDIEVVRRFRIHGNLFGEDKRPIEEKRIDRILQAYGFQQFDEMDELILAGLRSGAFDISALRSELQILDAKNARRDGQTAVAKPWTIFADSFANDEGDFLDALVDSIEKHANIMSPAEASDAIIFLRELGRPDEAERLIPIYVAAQINKPREFFAATTGGYRRVMDPALAAALLERLDDMELVKDPGDLLLEIGRKRGWDPADIAFLATVPVEEYRKLLKRLTGSDLDSVISVALEVIQHRPRTTNGAEVSMRMAKALRLISEESELNALRVKPHLKGLAADAEFSPATEGASDSQPVGDLPATPF